MEQVVKGIIIHQTRFADTSSIVRIFCQHHGMKPFMVRSAKSSRSSVTNLLQPLNLVEFESPIKENTQIQQLRNLRISHPFHHSPFDPVKSAMIIFLDEVLYKTIPDDYVNDKLYKFIRDAMILLDDALDARNFHLWCLLEITRHYGFYPQREPGSANMYFDLISGEFSSRHPGHAQFLQGQECIALLGMIEKEWPQVQLMELHSVQRKILLETLVQYVRMHLESLREIKSLGILHEIFH